MNKNELDALIKWVLGGLMILGALYFFPWGDITWGKIVMKSEGMVTVSGYAESDEKNQIAQFSAGVSAIADKKDVAVNEVNTKMAALIKAVKAFGVAEADIQTQQVNVYQMQERAVKPVMMRPDYIDDGRVKLGQWSASNSISITLRNVDKASQLTDILNNSGANNVYGPNFQLDTSKKAGDELLGKAVADAKVKAEMMAATSGARLGRVVSIVEGGQSSNIYPMMAFSKSDISAVPAPMEPGTSKVSKTVTVVWSLR